MAIPTALDPSAFLPALPAPEADGGAALGLDGLRAAVREYVRGIRAQLAEAHGRGTGGRAGVDLYTARMDDLIAYLFNAADYNYGVRYSRLGQRCAAVAQGGYGRRELNPGSDIDLLFLSPGKVTPYVEIVCETIYYSLLDTVTVAQAVLSVRGCVSLANRDQQVKTALLDARYLCGDHRLYQEFAGCLEREVFSRSNARFLREKVREREARSAKYGDSVYVLEPHIKEGMGGLRDLHTSLWLAKVHFKVKTLQELVQKGVESPHALSEIASAQDFLLRLRTALHLLTGAHEDRLSFAHQDQIAPTLGFASAADLMHRYYGHATVIRAFFEHLAQRCTAPARPYSLIGRPQGRNIREGVRIVADALVVTDANLFAREPVNLLSVFHDAQRHGVRLDAGTRRLVRQGASRLGDGAAPGMWQALWAILGWKTRVYETLHEMHTLGVLGHLIPELARLRWLTQRDLYHVYTVDEHSLRGIAELERLRAGAYKEEHPLLTQVMRREVDRPGILFLAMLFHDVGKGHGSNHHERGAAIVAEVAGRWAVDQDALEEWLGLVRLHLLMSHHAQRRDLSDDALIVDFARNVGTPALLKKLYLLTFADMKAVGPRVWNSWKGTLLDELYLRTLEVFEKGVFVEEARQERVARAQQRLRHALAAQGVSPAAIGLLEAMPDSYFLATPEEAVPQHLKLLSRFVRGGDEVVSAVEHFVEREYSEFTVVTRDRPGLFAMLAGVLAASGLNVASARITTTSDGVALDVFRLSHLDQHELVMAPARWERVDGSLRAVLRGEKSVEAMVRASRPPEFLTPRPARVRTAVDVDNATSRQYTVIDVETWDRLGLLFTITHCLFSLGLRIHIAKITTNVDQVLDVFYVTDNAGRKVAGRRSTRIKEALFKELAAGGGDGG